MEFTDAQRQEIKDILHEALTEWITGYGVSAKNIIVGAAAILVALAVIGKAVAWILGTLGFTYLAK